MSFSPKIRDDAFLKCGRYCCLCKKFCGTKIELHHIVHKSEGGEDTLENCIALCFDCHADMTSYDHKHPKGSKYSVAELKRHRDSWYAEKKSMHSLAVDTTKLEVDRKTFKNFLQELPYQGALEFIEKHDFGASFRRSRLEPLDRYLEKESDPLCKFLDDSLENLRRELVDAIFEFREYLSLNTWPMEERDWQGIPHEWEFQQRDRQITTINNLNTLSVSVYVAYNELVVQCRKRLG